ncbi:MAG: polymer-forming cytoskeletal protein [Epsilonproteobacteria bacterium]|nr:hypothetical protein [Campylobacterota bacterium]NPA56170.1 polymer-forming cytoskeletal protein [Campylobacterota bacterium]
MKLKKKRWFMQIFGVGGSDQEFEQSEHGDQPGSASIVTEGTTVMGKIVGNDSVHVDGVVRGDIKVNNIVIIGKNGKVYGDLRAKQVICNGECSGNIIADSFEVLEDGRCEGDVRVNKILVKGKYKGNLICGGLFVDHGGEVQVVGQVKKVVVAGVIDGNLACKELRTLPTSILRGRIFADEIQNEGGRIECYIGRFSDLAKENEQARYYLGKFNAIEGYILLEDKEYYTDVEAEQQGEEMIEAEIDVEERRG